MHKLVQSVLGHIRKANLLRPGDRAGIAVSGGADSVALLRLMIDLRHELGIVLQVFHLNHRLRAAESDADEQFVRQLAEAHGLEVSCESRDVKAFANEKQLSIEAAARELRYDFFRHALQSGVNRIATAHTLDDQAETVLLKMMRGAGTRGLAGIYPTVTVSRGPLGATSSSSASASLTVFDECSIVRPLLGTRRSDLREYLAEIDQDWREDSTNLDLRHTRNRIRHEILPRLSEVNPSFCEVLAETAEIARGEEEYWSSEVCRLLPQLWSRGDQALRRDALRDYPRAVQRRMVRAAAESLGLPLEFRHIEAIVALVHSPGQHEGDSCALPGGWMAMARGSNIEFCNSPEPSRCDKYEYDLSVPGTVVVAEAGVALECLLRNSGEGADCAAEELLDRAIVPGHLKVRNWRPGERFWPAHAKQPKKIKELLQDKHITGACKKLWPVVTSGEEIVWLRGFGVAHPFRAAVGEGILLRERGKSTKA